MPFPASVQTVTLTLGPLYNAKGDPVTGAILSATLPDVVRILEDGAVLPSTVTARTGADGVASLTVVATDSTGVDRTGFTYRVVAHGLTTGIDVSLPAAVPAVDVEDLVPVAASSGTVWVPAGAFATAEQGALADTAVQPDDLAAVATSGAYGDLDGRPALGTAAAADVETFATAEQGSKADEALASADLDQEVAALVASNGSGLQERLSAAYAMRELSLAAAPAYGVQVTSGTTSTPAAIEVFGGYVWATGGGSIHRSADHGDTWTVYCPSPLGDAVRRLIPTSDGEVVAATTTQILRSSGWSTGTPTWTTKITANGTADFQPFSVSGDGQKFIASQYGDRPSSRYAHISVDAGVTWALAWDSVARFGAAAADVSHLHGAEYDPWGDRFYLAEGHSDGGDIAGVYVSEDDGATWTRPAGLALNPAPTVLVATDAGLVCGADNAEPGLYGIVRQPNLSDEVLRRTFAWRPGVAGVIGFGARGFREPVTGVVYVGFRTGANAVAPIIAGGTPSAGALVYEWPTTSGVVIADDLRSCILPSPTRMLAAGKIAGTEYRIKGALPAPGAAPILDQGGILGGLARNGESVAVAPKASTAATARSVAVGVGASTTGDDAVAIGKSATAAQSATAVGQGANAGHTRSLALGRETATTAVYQVALGPRQVLMLNTLALPATVAGAGTLYVEGGALKFKGGSGTVTTIAPA